MGRAPSTHIHQASLRVRTAETMPTAPRETKIKLVRDCGSNTVICDTVVELQGTAGLKCDGGPAAIVGVWSSNSAYHSLTGSPMMEDAPALR